MAQKNLTPDEQVISVSNTPTTKKTPVKRGLKPNKQDDFGPLGLQTVAAWRKEPKITLLWITVDEYEKKVLDYTAVLEERFELGSDRPTLTKSLSNINQSIDEGIGMVKIYLSKKYKGAKNAYPYYAKFGLVKNKNRYDFPIDNDTRLKLLPTIIKSIKAEGFDKEEYGLTFWNNIKKDFTSLLKASKDTVQSVSKKVQVKDELLRDIKKVMNSLIFSIKANYPDTWQSELRAWGFLKENY